jgi:hypothetical protein
MAEGKVMSRDVLVIGHSFVRRLGQKVGGLQVLDDGCRVHIEGYGGLKVPGLEERVVKAMSRGRYGCVVMEIGSNDLCEHGATSDVVAGKIVGLCKKVRDQYDVEVVVFETLERERECRWLEVDLGVYNERVRTLNGKLKEGCEGGCGGERITFRTHYPHAKRLGDDGIHIGERWMNDYWKSVRGAVVCTMRSARERD